MKTKQKLFKILAAAAILGTTTVASTSVFAATDTNSTLTQTHYTATGHHHKRHSLLEDTASILGIDTKTLHTELKSGKSIVELAKAKNISEQTLIQGLKSKLQARLDKAVQEGKVTQEKRQRILSNADKKLKRFVEHKHMEKKNVPMQ